MKVAKHILGLLLSFSTLVASSALVPLPPLVAAPTRANFCAVDSPGSSGALTCTWGWNTNSDGTHTGSSQPTVLGATILCLCVDVNAPCATLVASSGDTFITVAISTTGFHWNTALWRITNAASQTTVTTTDGSVLGCVEDRGVQTTGNSIDQFSSLDNAQFTAPSNQAINGGSITTTAGNEIIHTFCVNEEPTVATFLPGSGWTAGNTSQNDANFYEQYRVAASIGTFTGSATISSSGVTQPECITISVFGGSATVLAQSIPLLGVGGGAGAAAGNNITLVQHPAPCSSGSQVGTLTCSFVSLPTVGNCVAVITISTGTSTDYNITDNQSGNSYAHIAGASSSTNETVAVSTTKVVGSSGTFTTTSTTTFGTQFITIFLLEYSGVATSTNCTTDGANTAGGSGTAMSPGTITTTNANDTIVGACGNGGGATVTFTPNTSAPNNFVTESQQTNSSSFFAGAAIDQKVTATNTFTPSITDSASGSWQCGAFALKST